MKTFLTFLLLLSLVQFSFAQQADTKASQIADEVMVALGGQKAWNETRHIHWNFFGSRALTWDKWTGDVRIDFLKENTTYLVNVNNLKGKALVKGVEVTEPDSLKKLMKRAEGIWINDSYWLVMPYKLKDKGVNLRYLGKENDADVLELTFNAVGNTPENKYHVFVDPTTHLVNQWAYYANASDEKPKFTLPWADYQKHGNILLSGNRGERQLTEIQTYKKLPKTVYTSFAKPKY